MIAQHRNYQPPCRDYATATLDGCFNQQNVNGWTGVPLIRRPRKYNSASHQSPAPSPASIVCPQSTKNYDESTLSKLALQTHGMPLILSSSGRYRNRNFYRTQQQQQLHPNQYMQNKQHHLYPQPNHHHHNPHLLNQSSSTSAIHKITENNQNLCNKHIELDTNSNSSSSSLSSSATDTCLPRIIKPRKRRKKDRKPQTVSNDSPLQTSSSSTTISSSSLQTSYTINNENSNNSNNNDSALPTTQTDNFLTTLQQSSPCYCRLCDPSHRIWAFPLRRSYSDNTPEIELHKTKDVGVIGSNRPQTATIMNQSRTGSFSDDSGIFDFSQNGFGFAESLLTESINEISKKLENGSGSCDSSSDCSSVFSDAIGGNDLFFNFENLTIATKTSTNSGFNCNNSFNADAEDDDDDGDILLNCLDMVLNSKANCT